MATDHTRRFTVRPAGRGSDTRWTDPATPGARDSAALAAEPGVQGVLFGPDRVPGVGDVRSVGEILVDVDRSARGLLLDAGGDPGAMLNSWPGLLDAAVGVWSACPDPDQFAAPAAEQVPAMLSDLPLHRMARDTSDILVKRKALRAGTRSDRRIEQMTGDLHRVAGLIRNFSGTVITGYRPEVLDDIAVLRARLVHALYLSAHACQVAIHDHGRRLYDQDQQQVVPEIRRSRVNLSRTSSPYLVHGLSHHATVLQRCERYAHEYLMLARDRPSNQPPTSPAPGDGVGSEVVAERVAASLAGWDAAAHHALRGIVSPPDLALIAYTQSHILTATQRLLHTTDTEDLPAHAPTRTPPQPDHRPTLQHHLAESARYWNNLGRRWADLDDPTTPDRPRLARASADIRAALAGLAPTATSPTPTARTHGPRQTLLQALTDQRDLVEVYTQQAHQPRHGLTGPPDKLIHRILQDRRDHADTSSPQPQAQQGSEDDTEPEIDHTRLLDHARTGMTASGAQLLRHATLAAAHASASTVGAPARWMPPAPRIPQPPSWAPSSAGQPQVSPPVR